MLIRSTLVGDTNTNSSFPLKLVCPITFISKMMPIRIALELFIFTINLSLHGPGVSVCKFYLKVMHIHTHSQQSFYVPK